MMMTVIFPSSYFSDKAPDEEMAGEFAAVRETGLFETVLFSNEKWFERGELSVGLSPASPVEAVYRGWMMKPPMYRDFYERLREKNICLITSPEEYERFHIFPNIYPAFDGDTAEMMVFPEGCPVELERVRERFSRFMVKDHVKSVKGTAFPRYFDSSVSREEFERQMEIFYKFRGGLFTGGICIKEYLELEKYGERTNEFRVFYAGGQVLSVSRNSGQPVFAPEPPMGLIGKYTGLGSPFYTVDYAETADGEWKVIEAGDGQVSGLSDGQDIGAFFRGLHCCIG